MTDTPIGIRFDTLSMSHTSSPFSFVCSSVFPMTFPESFVTSIDPRSQIISTIRKRISSMSLSLSLYKVTFIGGSIGPFEGTIAMSLVFQEGPIIDTSIGPTVHSTSVTLIKTIFTFVGITISKGGPAISMPTAMPPITFIGTSIVFIYHSTQSMRHTRATQHNTRILSLVSVGIQQGLRNHLLTIFSIGTRCHCVAHTLVVILIDIFVGQEGIIIKGGNRDILRRGNLGSGTRIHRQIAWNGTSMHIKGTSTCVRDQLWWSSSGGQFWLRIGRDRISREWSLLIGFSIGSP
mmetsp:Transcript_27310/g.63421  ORF Transcript_27310/g.63421 Transcript_27310/m.63421 type:complete len:292 (-) Transcript_27310:739-1614(-)